MQGFQNTGAICYFNAVVQSLLGLDQFKAAIQSGQGPNVVLNMFKAYFGNESGDPLFTTELLKTLSGSLPGNQSASEFLLILIDALGLDPKVQREYLITRTCPNCGAQVTGKDVESVGLVDKTFTEILKMQSVVDGFLCEKCRLRVGLDEVRVLTRGSEMIFVSLNKYFEKKVIDYPSVFGVDNHLYRLKATIEHVGELNGGHYYARVCKDGVWWVADDMRTVVGSGPDPTRDT